jgi:hypothetical protein
MAELTGLARLETPCAGECGDLIFCFDFEPDFNFVLAVIEGVSVVFGVKGSSVGEGICSNVVKSASTSIDTRESSGGKRTEPIRDDELGGGRSGSCMSCDE